MLKMQVLLIIGIFLLKNVFCGDVWNNYQFDSGIGNREEIFIQRIIAQENFTITSKILKWKSGINTDEVAIGMGLKDLSLLKILNETDDKILNTKLKRLDFQETISDAILISHYNWSSRIDQKILIVAVEDDTCYHIKWFKLDDGLNTELFWTWNVQKRVIHMTYTEIEEKLILIHGDNTTDSNVGVYSIFLDSTPKFSLVQDILLEASTDNSGINFDGYTTYLSLPQADHVRILKYHKKSFIPHKNITCTFVEQVTAFHIGIHAYLAFDGLNAGIYQFTSHTLVKQEVNHGQLEGSNHWLRIPLKTYRQEDILLAQRSLSHGSYDSLMVEVISFDSGKFSIHEETECDYFGDILFGFNCITDENHSLGIKNAAILGNGEAKAIVLSHSDGTTSMFKINVVKRDIPSPVTRQIKKLQESRKKIQEAIDKFQINQNSLNQIDGVQEPELLKQTNPVNWNLQPEKLINEMNVEELTRAIEAANVRIEKNNILLEKRRRGHFDTIIINGLLEVHGVSNIRHVETNSEFTGTLDDIARIDHITKISGHKEFANIKAENLTFESVNGIDAKAIKYRNEPLYFDGDVTFEKSVIVEGNLKSKDDLINGINLKRDVVNITKKVEADLKFGNVIVSDTFTTNTVNKFAIHNKYLDAFVGNNTNKVDELEFDKLYLPGNLTVTYINSKHFDDFLQTLCLKNIGTYIPGTTNVTGKVSLQEQSYTKMLNSLQYPEDYVLHNTEDFTRFTANKHFKVVKANEATTSLLNDIRPEDIVTLSGDQDLKGKFIFDHLEISESISVGGEVTGNDQNVFIPNPTMKETNQILANVNFKTLNVEGKIIIQNQFNGSSFSDTMSKVVYKNQGKIRIDSSKQFTKGITVIDNLAVTSNIINKFNVQDLALKSLEEELSLHQIFGKVGVENLQIQGLMNGCNISKLERETVKLSGDQFLTSKFTFGEDIIVSNTLDIRESLNGLTEFDILFNDGDRVLNLLNMKDIIAERVVIEKNLQTQIDNFNLEEFEDTRLSYTKDQYLSGIVEAANVNADYLNASVINDHLHTDLFNADKYRQKILELFFTGKVAVQNLIVEETLNISSINDVILNELFGKCIWTKGSNVYNEPIVFLDNVYCNKLVIENFNNVPFEDFANNIIYRNETDVTFSGLQTYTNGFSVKNYIDAHFINNIHVNNVLRKNGDQTIRSQITILGDVEIVDADIGNMLNGVPVQDFIESYQRVDVNTFKINGDVMFNRFAKIDNLMADGFVNGRNITNYFQSLVNRDEDIVFSGTTVFEDSVYVKGNIDVQDSVNGINLESFNENLVTITTDAQFDDIVTFGEPVNIMKKLYIETDFISRFVNGIDMQSWLENATYINKGIIPGNVAFDHGVMNGNMVTNYVNGLNISTLIPLRTDEELDMNLVIGNVEMFGDINVGNFVNGVKLQQEFAKSVMADQDNFITSDITFEENIVVREDLTILSKVNHKDLNRIITTNTDQIIHSKFIFAEPVFLDQGLASNGLLNDINLTDWEGGGLKKAASYVQNLVQPVFAEKVIFDANVIGVTPVNNMDARTLADQVEGKRLIKQEIEEKLVGSYPDVCADVNYALKLAKHELYSFNYLEHSQYIDFENDVETIHNFVYQGTYYLLVHERNTCITHILSWSKSRFYPVGKIESGVVHQFITMWNKDQLFFVTRSDSLDTECSVLGSNVWQFVPDDISIMVIFNIEDNILLQESKTPGVFYGVLKDNVVEYHLKLEGEITLEKYRKWRIVNENIAFIPRELYNSLAIRDGFNTHRLLNEDPVPENDIPSGFESVFIGKVSSHNNSIFPGRYTGETLVLTTGEYNKHIMVAVTHRGFLKKSSNIKIYEDIKNLTLYEEIKAVNPSSLFTLPFGNNGETFLGFLEDNIKLIMFEYKGIFGFVERLSADIQGTDVKPMILNNRSNQEQHYLAVINRNQINMLHVLMQGNKIRYEAANCEL